MSETITVSTKLFLDILASHVVMKRGSDVELDKLIRFWDEHMLKPDKPSMISLTFHA